MPTYDARLAPVRFLRQVARQQMGLMYEFPIAPPGLRHGLLSFTGCFSPLQFGNVYLGTQAADDLGLNRTIPPNEVTIYIRHWDPTRTHQHPVLIDVATIVVAPALPVDSVILPCDLILKNFTFPPVHFYGSQPQQIVLTCKYPPRCESRIQMAVAGAVP